MEKLGREVLGKIIINFYCQEKKWTQAKLANKIDVNHTSISNWMKGKNICTRNFDTLVSFLQAYVELENETVKFYEYLLGGLEEQGYDVAKCSSIIETNGNLTSKIKRLLDESLIRETQAC